jgi:ribosomal protein S18 acetylase RimI-like enzyme
MDRIQNYNQIQDSIIKVKTYKEGFVTNFFIGENRCNLLIKKEKLYIVSCEQCIFILHKDYDFYHLYFLTTASDRLVQSLEELIQRYDEFIFVVDIVGTLSFIEPLSLSFKYVGFDKCIMLYRMRRLKGIDQKQELDNRVQYANLEQAKQVHDLLEEHFDKYCEQIPLVEEIEEWAKNKKVLVIVDRQKVIGFILFEITGMTSYLKYWFIHPDYRNQKIGSVLLRQYFHECCNVKRQLLWIINTNDNAVKRYIHYGFEQEQMFDEIMVKWKRLNSK